MILVTTGTMFPFDRLIEGMDRWAGDHSYEQVFAQIGTGSVVPRNMAWTRLLTPREFAERVRACTVLVAHAGTGSFFLAAEMGKPVVMLPRLAANHEHTTDHQVHTARWLREKPGVYVAMTLDELPGALDLARAEEGRMLTKLTPFAPQPFLEQIRSFLVA